jgi:hypothetical protein
MSEFHQLNMQNALSARQSADARVRRDYEALHPDARGEAFPSYDAAMKRNWINYYRKCLSSAQRHGAYDQPFRDILRELGAERLP